MFVADKIGAPPELVAMSAYYDQVIGSPITFLEALRLFSQNKGYSIDYHTVELSLEMHPLEDDYFPDGVRFSVDVPHAYEAEVIVSYKIFYYYLSKVCILYLEIHPRDSQEVKKLLSVIHSNLNLN